MAIGSFRNRGQRSFSASGEDEEPAQDYDYSEAYFEVRPRDRLTGLGDSVAEVAA